MAPHVWWVVSGPTYGIYKQLFGAFDHLEYRHDGYNCAHKSADCETAINELIRYAKLPKNAQHIYTDGSLMNGTGSCAFYNATTGETCTNLFGCRSSSAAEFQGVSLALRSIREQKNKSFIIFTDFLPACCTAWNTQLGREVYIGLRFGTCWKQMKTLMNTIDNLDPSIKVYFVHVPSKKCEGNRRADMLASRAITEPETEDRDEFDFL